MDPTSHMKISFMNFQVSFFIVDTITHIPHPPFAHLHSAQVDVVLSDILPPNTHVRKSVPQFLSLMAHHSIAWCEKH